MIILRFSIWMMIALFSLLDIAAVNAQSTGSETTATQSTAPAVSSGDYVLQSSDLLRLQIFQEDDLTRDVRISQEGAVVLPLIGKIDLRGRTLREAEELIRALYDKDYLVNPQVSLSVSSYASKKVDVLGAVNKPGTVDFLAEQNMTLLTAIAQAGGFSRLADRKRVILTRIMPDGHSEKSTINADDVIRGEKENIILFKDDVIFVGERIL